MKSFEFIKMHGLGNDFVIIDISENVIEIKNKEKPLSDLRKVFLLTNILILLQIIKI